MFFLVNNSSKFIAHQVLLTLRSVSLLPPSSPSTTTTKENEREKKSRELQVFFAPSSDELSGQTNDGDDGDGGINQENNDVGNVPFFIAAQLMKRTNKFTQLQLKFKREHEEKMRENEKMRCDRAFNEVKTTC